MINKKFLIPLFTIIIFMTACSGGGPQFPFDTGYSDSSDLAQEYAEGRLEAERYDDYDPGEKWDNSRERKQMEQEDRMLELDSMADEEMGFTTSSGDGCPNGCKSHKSGCDIKGNISFNSGEKIYHVPGQNFYSETEINPNKGERWFCTEAEARANGWRKAKN